MMTTTLNEIKKDGLLNTILEKLLNKLGKTKADDEPLTILEIIDAIGFHDAMSVSYVCKTHHKDLRLFSAWCAREALKFTDDWQAVQFVNVLERYAHGMATKSELTCLSFGGHAAMSCRYFAEYAAWDAALYALRGKFFAKGHFKALNSALNDAQTAQEARFREIVS